MAFFKIASSPILASAISVANIEYAPESLGIRDTKYGDKLIRRMAEILPLRTDPDKYLYLRNWAISSLEKFGYNQNRDAWLYTELKRAYPTFVGSPVCCNHINNKPDKFYGLIPDSAFITAGMKRASWEEDPDWQQKFYSPHAKYGEKAGWVENILAINKALIELDYPGLVDDLESGRVKGTSMGVLCQYSICSKCGRKARNESEYCSHIRDLRKHGIVTDETVFEINFDNTFFEDSIIIANTQADDRAIILNKYAKINAFRQSIRNEFLPFIKLGNIVLTEENEIKNYCDNLNCKIASEEKKEGNERQVSGRYRPRGGWDTGAKEKDIVRVVSTQKNPAEIGKRYVQNCRMPTYDPTDQPDLPDLPEQAPPPMRFSDTLRRLSDRIAEYEETTNALDTAFEKKGLGEGEVDVMTGLLGPSTLVKPPESYMENLKGIEEELDEKASPEESSFDVPVRWAEPEDTIESAVEDQLEDVVMEGGLSASLEEPMPTPPIPGATPPLETEAPTGPVMETGEPEQPEAAIRPQPNQPQATQPQPAEAPASRPGYYIPQPKSEPKPVIRH